MSVQNSLLNLDPESHLLTNSQTEIPCIDRIKEIVRIFFSDSLKLYGVGVTFVCELIAGASLYNGINKLQNSNTEKHGTGVIFIVLGIILALIPIFACMYVKRMQGNDSETQKLYA